MRPSPRSPKASVCVVAWKTGYDAVRNRPWKRSGVGTGNRCTPPAPRASVPIRRRGWFLDSRREPILEGGDPSRAPTDRSSTCRPRSPAGQARSGACSAAGLVTISCRSNCTRVAVADALAHFLLRRRAGTWRGEFDHCGPAGRPGGAASRPTVRHAPDSHPPTPLRTSGLERRRPGLRSTSWWPRKRCSGEGSSGLKPRGDGRIPTSAWSAAWMPGRSLLRCGPGAQRHAAFAVASDAGEPGRRLVAGKKPPGAAERSRHPVVGDTGEPTLADHRRVGDRAPTRQIRRRATPAAAACTSNLQAATALGHRHGRRRIMPAAASVGAQPPGSARLAQLDAMSRR